MTNEWKFFFFWILAEWIFVCINTLFILFRRVLTFCKKGKSSEKYSFFSLLSFRVAYSEHTVLTKQNEHARCLVQFFFLHFQMVNSLNVFVFLFSFFPSLCFLNKWIEIRWMDAYLVSALSCSSTRKCSTHWNRVCQCASYLCCVGSICNVKSLSAEKQNA